MLEAMTPKDKNVHTILHMHDALLQHGIVTNILQHGIVTNILLFMPKHVLCI